MDKSVCKFIQIELAFCVFFLYFKQQRLLYDIDRGAAINLHASMCEYKHHFSKFI